MGKELADRVRKIRDSLAEGLVERDVAVRLALLAALSGEHLLLVGPPGTGKSLVARRLRHAFKNTTYFERLLTKFSVPEELFGPLSIKGLEEDRYERLTESYLPTASIAFLDEIFKANSAILNSLLTLLNEREFDNGTRREKTPLVAVVGASNELPEGEELDALFDRFLLRLHVGPVSKESFPKLLELRGDCETNVPETIKLTRDERNAVQEAAQSVKIPDDVSALLYDLREWCAAEGIVVSDRRWRKVLGLLQISAHTNGRDAVSIWDCWLLQHCLCRNDGDSEKIYNWYASRIGVTKEDPLNLIRNVNSLESRLARDKKGKSQKQDKDGKPLFINKMDQTTTEKFEVDRYGKKVEFQPAMESTKQKSAYVRRQLQNLEDRRREIDSHRSKISRQIETCKNDIHDHLWITDDFSETAAQGLDKALSDAEDLLNRLKRVGEGFESLPREEEESDAV